MLEGQLSQLSAAISSREALIATLQANEAEAKSMGALYLVRWQLIGNLVCPVHLKLCLGHMFGLAAVLCKYIKTWSRIT